MAEYIEREAALTALCRDCDKMVPTEERDHCSYRFTGCMEYYNIFDLPAADVRPVVRGRWIDVEDSTLSTCSVCGFNVGAYTFHYCPNCGADMGEAKT